MKDIYSEVERYLDAVIVIGIEIEFYTKKRISIKSLQNKLGKFKIVREIGKNQYEIIIGPLENYQTTIKAAEKVQNIIRSDHDLILEPKPFEEQPSSGTHININFLNKNGGNLFSKQNGQDPEILLYGIGGLLKTLKQNLKHFAPTDDALKRYTGGIHNPSKICWGYNNRTAAIRIPDSQSGGRRIEFRVPSSNCNLSDSVKAMLEGIMLGIKNKIDPGEKLYGNAFLEQYNFKKILD